MVMLVTENEYLSMRVDPIDGHLKATRDNGDTVDFGAVVGEAVAEGQVSGWVNGSGPLISALLARFVDKTTAKAIDQTTGVDRTGGVDATATVNAIAASIPQRQYSPIVFPPGVYRFDNTVTLDMYRTWFLAPWGGVLFDFRNMPADRPAIHVTSSGAPSGEWGNEPPLSTIIDGIRLQGPGSGADCIGVYLHTTTSGGRVANATLRNLSIRSFGDGVRFGDNAYCLTFDQVLIHRATNGMNFPAGTSNSGERLTLRDSTIYGSSVAFRIAGDGRFHVANSSVDYNKQVVVIGDSGGLILRDTHVEGYFATNAEPDPWFVRTGPGSILVDGGTIAASLTNTDGNSGPVKLAMIDNQADPRAASPVLFDNVSMRGVRFAAGGQFSTGVGRTRVRALTTGTSGTAGQLWTRTDDGVTVDGGAEAGNLQDEWFITSDTAAITAAGNGPNLITGANVKVETSTDIARTGTRSFKVTKTNSSGNAAVGVAVPVARGGTNLATAYLAKHAAIAGTVYTRFVYVAIVRAPDGVPTVRRRDQVIERSTALSGLTVDQWTGVSTPLNWVPAPPWATHFMIEFVLTSMTTAGGALYVDGLNVSEA